MTISVDYNQFLKLPLSVFEDESVVKGYMEIAKENIRSEARTLPRKDWEFFQEKVAVFNEEVEAMVKSAIESMKENRAREDEEAKEKKAFQDQIDLVGSRISKIYKDEEFNSAVDALNQGKKEMIR